MKTLTFRPLIKCLALFSLLLTSSAALAITQLCFKKEISNDGINWQDANIEAEAVSISDVAHFRFSAFKCPESWGGLKNITMDDPQLNIYDQPMDNLSGDENDFTPSVWTTSVENYCEGYVGSKENIASAIGYSMISDTPRYASDNAWAMCEPEIEIGGEGCTPGYWKQVHHLRSWPTFAFKRFSSVFGRNITIKLGKKRVLRNPSLFAVLWAKGGKVNASARHAVAAYLNALSNDVNYDLTADSVIEGFQTSFDNGDFESFKDSVEEYNQQGCPLN